MRLNRYPFKYAIFYILVRDQKLHDLKEIMEALKDDFGEEKQFNKKTVQTHLDAFVGVGMCTMSDETITENGELEAKYQVTKFGLSRQRFLPKEWFDEQ